ncbi:MAG: flagellar hook capping protein [Clostridia bacterium]|nr:flagellar hook capping protein [Clostridia bacterium]
MAVGQVNNLNNNYGFGSKTEARNTGELGKDDFLKLFVEQLKAQDPLSPMDNNEFIAQSAQFTQLEQMTNLNTNITSFLEQQTTVLNSVLYAQTSTQALNLVGKQVTAYVANDAEGFDKVEGVVDKVTFNGAYQVLHIGDKEVFLDEVSEVGMVPAEDGAEENEE